MLHRLTVQTAFLVTLLLSASAVTLPANADDWITLNVPVQMHRLYPGVDTVTVRCEVHGNPVCHLHNCVRGTGQTTVPVSGGEADTIATVVIEPRTPGEYSGAEYYTCELRLQVPCDNEPCGVTLPANAEWAAEYQNYDPNKPFTQEIRGALYPSVNEDLLPPGIDGLQSE